MGKCEFEMAQHIDVSRMGIVVRFRSQIRAGGCGVTSNAAVTNSLCSY